MDASDCLCPCHKHELSEAFQAVCDHEAITAAILRDPSRFDEAVDRLREATRRRIDTDTDTEADDPCS